MTVRAGSGGGFGSCSGFVSQEILNVDTPLALFMDVDSYAVGLGGWSVTGDVPGGESRTFEVSWRFDTAGMSQAELDQLQNDRTGLDFQWELQST